MGPQIVSQKAIRTGATTALFSVAVKRANYLGKKVILLCANKPLCEDLRKKLENYEKWQGRKLDIQIEPLAKYHNLLCYRKMKILHMQDHEVLVDHYAIETHFDGLLKQLKSQKPEIFQDEEIIHSPAESRIMELFSDGRNDQDNQWKERTDLPWGLWPEFEEPAERE